MRLDPRHFNRFMLITALFSMIAIAWFTVRHQQRKEASFEREIREAFPSWWTEHGMEPSSPYHVIVFWAPWSERSIQVLRQVDASLSGQREPLEGRETHPSQPRVRFHAFGVKDSPEALREPAFETGVDASWLDGTEAYSDLRVPGVPTLIVADSIGGVIHVDMGIDPGTVAATLARAIR